MLYSGCYYTASHSINAKYRGGNLHDQAVAATKKGIHWGLYHIVRARSVDEAKPECEQLYYTSLNYVPAYGLWLKLDLGNDKTTNDAILDYYYKQLCSWGFQKACGIYCGQTQLDRITWSKHNKHFYLMYINRLSGGDYSDLEKVLDPTFFVVKD